MWHAHTESLPEGWIWRTRIHAEHGALCTADVLRLWREDTDFADFFSTLLTDVPFDAYFWETPPLYESSVSQPFEFVFVESDVLARVAPDPNAFREHFADAGDAPVTTFDNLGRDAVLVAPCPLRTNSGYPHLAHFAREAPATQKRALWGAVGRAIGSALSAEPLWVSTSGLGVAWLHVRLDRSPKYYTYAPYRDGRR